MDVAVDDADADALVGKDLCDYNIVRKLAEGSMGVVYAGIHRRSGRTRALKVLKLELCRSKEMVARFHQEARALHTIQHEHIVEVYDIGRARCGRVFFVMEYLEGESLSARLRRGPLRWPDAFPILDQILRALQATHDKGFVHRDLKPDNIWLTYVHGHVHVKLIDFGIAKLIRTGTACDELTLPGSVLGTPHYMSPEQISGLPSVDHRTDIYALGVITYEMFSGVTPFGGKTTHAAPAGRPFREPPRLAAISTSLGVPAAMTEIVDRMLRRTAAHRYESADDVLSDLRAVGRNQRPANADLLRRVRPGSHADHADQACLE